MPSLAAMPSPSSRPMSATKRLTRWQRPRSSADVSQPVDKEVSPLSRTRSQLVAPSSYASTARREARRHTTFARASRFCMPDLPHSSCAAGPHSSCVAAMAGPHFSLLSTDLDNAFSGNIDDILAASLSNTASSLADTTSNLSSSSRDVVMPDLGNSRSSTDAFESCSGSHCSGRQTEFLAAVAEITEEEARAEALSIEAEQQLVELKAHMVLLERTKHQQAQSAKHLSSLKAKRAIEEGGGPENWAISIQQLRDFTDGIKVQLRQYCMDHRCESGTFAHVCANQVCNHDHGCAQYRALLPDEDPTKHVGLEPNMHTVVSVFIKPMTKDNHGVRGLALKLNEKHLKKVEKFISHSWSGRFEDFVATLCSNLLPQTAVFICSFALPQNLDVGPILDAKLENTPFAQAHDVASEVFLVIDKSIDVIERVWVIYELYLSHRRNKPIQIGFAERGADFRSKIMDKIDTIDVRSAKASKDADAQAIKAAIAGLEDNLNDEICTKLAEKVHQHQGISSKRRS